MIIRDLINWIKDNYDINENVIYEIWDKQDIIDFINYLEVDNYTDIDVSNIINILNLKCNMINDEYINDVILDYFNNKMKG